MTTATTTPALSAGAMPTNQLSLLLAFSAVPVLPATSTPLICAAVPVPCLTTPLRISRTRFAVSALMEVRSFSGCAVKLRWPLALYTPSTR